AATTHAGDAGSGPVVAAGRRIDLRRAAKVAEPDHQRRVEQPAIVQVLQQSRVGPIEYRQLAHLEALEIVLMRVPAAIGHRHEMNASLDEAARQQAALAEHRAAVALAQLLGLLVDGEGLLRRRRGDERMGLLVEGVAGLDDLRRFLDLLLIAVEIAEHGVAPLQSLLVTVAGNGQVTDLEAGGVGVIADLKRIELVAKESGDAAVEATVNEAPQLDKRQHAIAVAPFLGNDGAVAGER